MAIGQSRASRLVLPMSERDHIQGPADAPLALVEYGDYECPYCGLAHPIVKEVRPASAVGCGLRSAISRSRRCIPTR
jgi:hypothetical protein